MKKLIILSVTAMSLAIVSCNEKKVEETAQPTVDQAVQQMTQALDSTSQVVAADTAKAAAPAGH